jgi:DNA replication protein DnaC
MAAKRKNKEAENAMVSPVPLAGTSPEFQRLEQEVARRRERGIGHRAATVTRNTGREFLDLGQAMGEWLKKRNVTPEMIELGRKMVEEEDRAYRVRMRERAQQASSWLRMCPPRFRDPFDFKKVDPRARREGLEEVLGWQFGPRGMFIMGETGMSETTAAYALLHRLVNVEGLTVRAMDGMTLALEASYNFRESQHAESWLRALVKPDVLFIDDLAKRFTRATQEAFFAVIDRRGAALKPIIATTNCTGDMLAKIIDDPQLSDPLRRRMRQYGEIVVV